MPEKTVIVLQWGLMELSQNKDVSFLYRDPHHKDEMVSQLWPLLLTWINLIPAWISNYIHYNMQDEITYPFLNFQRLHRWSLGMYK